MPTPKFDPTITLGHLMQAAVLTVAVLFAYTDLVRVNDNQDLRIQALERAAERDYETKREMLKSLNQIQQDISAIKAVR